jgi:hypothetical protein
MRLAGWPIRSGCTGIARWRASGLQRYQRTQNRRRLCRHRLHLDTCELRHRLGDCAMYASSGCRRHVKSNPPLMSYRRATVMGDTPASRPSAAISRFSFTDHRRRLSPREIT